MGSGCCGDGRGSRGACGGVYLVMASLATGDDAALVRYGAAIEMVCSGAVIVRCAVDGWMGLTRMLVANYKARCCPGWAGKVARDIAMHSSLPAMHPHWAESH